MPENTTNNTTNSPKTNKNKPKVAGRKAKLTARVQQMLCEAISAGNYYEAACAYAGVSYRTFFRWMEKGETQRSGIYRQLWQAIQEAEGLAEVRVVAQWQNHIATNWQAARDFLERRHSKKWGKKDHLKVSLEEVTEVLTGITDIIKRYVKDEETLIAIQSEILKLTSERDGDESNPEE